jgi:hypothetical protein
MPRDRTSMLKSKIEREEDGRWIAEVAALSGVSAYGRDEDGVRATNRALGLRTISDRLEHGEPLLRQHQ